MPTGYTAEVSSGAVTDFRTFALRCARNFGACIMQRDDASNEPPKLREVSDYEMERVAKAEARLAEVTRMSPEDAEREAEAEYRSSVESRNKYEANRTETRNRYNAMLSQVMGWKPPTPEHEELKKFMVQQLTDSRRFDCDYLQPMPVQASGAEWLTRTIKQAQRECDRAAESLGAERERVAGANAWITSLYESLPPATEISA